MLRVLAAPAAKFAELEPRCSLLLILVSHVIAMLAITTLQRNVISRHNLILLVAGVSEEVVSGQWPVTSDQ